MYDGKTLSVINLATQVVNCDVVELDLPTTDQLITADPNLEGTHNQVAVKRGSLVDCLETVDLSDGVDISDVVVPQDIEVKHRFDGELITTARG